MPFDTWLLFFISSIGLSLTPGPNSLLVLTHGAMHGSRKTVFTIAGGVVGFVAVIALCMFGIGALIQSSIGWLTALKWLGGIYLVWVGIQLWRSPPIALDATTAGPGAGEASLFRQGLLSAVTNPKVLLFFSAFLPQFIDPDRGLLPQFAALAATYAATEFLVEYALATAAHRIRPWLQRAGRKFNRACGAGFIAIGVALPAQS